MIKIKNNTGSAKTWCGQEILSCQYYQIQEMELLRWSSDDSLLSSIASSEAIVNDGTSDISGINAQIEYLKDHTTKSVTVVSQPDPSPFAQSTYRTKRMASSSVVDVAPGETQEIQLKLTSERYMSGGCIIVENAQFGDYISCEVEDVDGVIPSPYRAATCEAHPIVSTYVEKEYVKVNSNGITVHELDARPLTAKVTAGLYMCVHYNAVNSGNTRKVVVNYYATKKI